MKNLLLILFLSLSSIFYAQQDTLKIPADELEEFFLALDTLETQDSAKAVLIQELEFEIKPTYFHRDFKFWFHPNFNEQYPVLLPSIIA